MQCVSIRRVSSTTLAVHAQAANTDSAARDQAKIWQKSSKNRAIRSQLAVDVVKDMPTAAMWAITESTYLFPQSTSYSFALVLLIVSTQFCWW